MYMKAQKTVSDQRAEKAKIKKYEKSNIADKLLHLTGLVHEILPYVGFMPENAVEKAGEHADIEVMLPRHCGSLSDMDVVLDNLRMAVFEYHYKFQFAQQRLQEASDRIKRHQKWVQREALLQAPSSTERVMTERKSHVDEFFGA